MSTPPDVRSVPHRRGNLLVVPHGRTLPPFCVKCGQALPAAWEPLQLSFTWQNPWWTLLLPLKLVPLVGWLIPTPSRRVELAIPLCAAHYGERRRYFWVGSAWIGGALFAGFVGVTLFPGYGILGVAGMIVGVLVGASFLSARQPLRPTRIDDERVLLKGAGEMFLSQLPSF